MLETINVQKELDKFFKELIKQSRSNLTRRNTIASKKLYREMTYTVKENKNSLEADFLLPLGSDQRKGDIPYGEYIDKGVRGVESGRSLAGYKYTTKRPPVSAIKKWMRVKPVKARNRSTGRFITQEQGAYLIANAIYKRGIEPTQFYSRPFERLFIKLPDELLEAYGEDLDEFLLKELK